MKTHALLLASSAALLAACSSSETPSLRSSVLNPLCPAEVLPDFSSAYRCYGNPADPARPAILLIPGTTLTPETSFSWNWFKALDALDRAYCTIELGDHGMNDIQDSAQVVAYGIRETYRRSGNRRIQVLGHSQGGMISRWAFKYWPETRGMVEDLVGWAPSNHGTVTARPNCVPSR